MQLLAVNNHQQNLAQKQAFGSYAAFCKRSEQTLSGNLDKGIRLIENGFPTIHNVGYTSYLAVSGKELGTIAKIERSIQKWGNIQKQNPIISKLFNANEKRLKAHANLNKFTKNLETRYLNAVDSDYGANVNSLNDITKALKTDSQVQKLLDQLEV